MMQSAQLNFNFQLEREQKKHEFRNIEMLKAAYFPSSSYSSHVKFSRLQLKLLKTFTIRLPYKNICRQNRKEEKKMVK